MSDGDTVNVTTLVAVEPARAFAVFTEQIGQWWRPQPRFHFMVGRCGTLRFEPGPEGRLLECYDVGPPYQVGRVLVWDPPSRLAFEFRARGLEPDLRTEVHLSFLPADGGTRVNLEHRGWDRVHADHPARRGLGSGPAFVTMMGLWWGEQLLALRQQLPRGPRVERARAPRPGWRQASRLS